MKLTFDNAETKLIIQQAFLRSPLASEPKQKLLLSIVLILFMLIPLCFTRCIQFTTVLEALYFQSEHTETNLSYIPSLLYSVNPNDPSQRGARRN